MKIPMYWNSGAECHVVAPSGRFSKERLESGLVFLRQAGFEPNLSKGMYDAARYLAGSDDTRRAGIAAALEATSLKVIWAARGGYGGARILPGLSMEEVAEKAPWLVGFSDVTALHALWARAGVCSIHGANITTLDMWTEGARSELFSLLDGTCRLQEFVGKPQRAGVAEGVLLGGNLTVLGSMVGTGSLPSFDGAVLLIEDIGEKPYRLDRTLTQMVQAGVFNGLRGVVIGQLTRCDAPGEPDYGPVDVIADVLEPLDVPIAFGFPFGHEANSRAVVLGGQATLDASSGVLKVSTEGHNA